MIVLILDSRKLSIFWQKKALLLQKLNLKKKEESLKNCRILQELCYIYPQRQTFLQLKHG
jgi:hypothetical protein